MKILVVSLLRLGDLIMQQPLLKMLQQQYPGAQIHLLMNRQFASSKFLVSEFVHEFHSFDRELYQQAMGNPEYNILYPFEHLENFISQLRSHQFDLVINLTHTRLSAYLCGLLEARDVRGAYYKNGVFQGIENRWMRYFDHRFAKHGRSIFHYVEALSSSFYLPVPERVQSAIVSNRQLILIQPLTSDRKKNWTISSYQVLLSQLKLKYSSFSFKIICAPFEKDIIEKYFASDDVLVLPLIELKEKLSAVRALITGDTSIMHLAAQQGVPTLEIALGSADHLKTGPYSDCYRVIASKISCYPCQHSENCFQMTQFCAHEVTVSEVITEFQLLLAGNYHQDNINFLSEKEIWRAFLNEQDCPSQYVNQNYFQNLFKYAKVLADIVNQENFGPEQAQQIVQLLRIIKKDHQDISFIFNPLEIIQHTNYPNLDTLAIQLKKVSQEISEQIIFRQKGIEVEHAQRN